MKYEMDAAAQKRLLGYFDQIGDVLGGKSRRASFALYAKGLLGEGERKSMEPLAARACDGLVNVDAIHQRLGHFINCDWSDRKVRHEAARYGLAAMTAREPIETWIVDDTGFLKQGTHSVGVQRQYTGSAGKVANCQVGVSLSVATRTEHLGVDFELYLPKSWTEDKARRQEGKIPDDVQFKTKPELALQMIDHAIENGVPRGVFLADEAYGNSCEFRSGLRARELEYAVAISATTKMKLVGENGLALVPLTAFEIAQSLKETQFRRTTWREGAGGKLSARFAARRVVTTHADGQPVERREVQWLLMEWRDGESAPAHFYLLTLPRSTSRKQMARIVKERYRTERLYEDLKGELGLDHFEGRRFRGWHHHMTVALCCYAFVIAEKVRSFFPSARGNGRHSSNFCETGAALCRFVHHNSVGHCACHHRLAAEMPDVPLLPKINSPTSDKTRIRMTQ